MIRVFNTYSIDSNLVVIVYRNNTFIGLRFISIDGYDTKELFLK